YFPSRFPGRFEFVKYGIFSIEKFVANHTGYEKKSEGWGIDDFLPFSVWTGNILSGDGSESTQKIEINKETLTVLVSALNTRMSKIKTILNAELNPVYEIIRREKSNLFQRENTVYTTVEQRLSHVLDITDNITIHMRNMSVIMQNIAMPSKVKALGLAGQKPEIVDMRLTQINETKYENMRELKNKVIPLLFKDIDSGKDDAVVTALEEHHRVIEENLKVVIERWSYVEKGANLILQQFTLLDEQTAVSISGGKLGALAIQIPEVIEPQRKLQESTTFNRTKSAIEFKRRQLDTKYRLFRVVVLALINKIFFYADGILADQEKSVNHQIRYLKTAKYQVKAYNSGLASSSLDPGVQAQQYEQKLTSEVVLIEEQIIELKRVLKLIRKLTSEINVNRKLVPGIIDAFKPYINQALFGNSHFGDIQKSVSRSEYIVENATLIFNDIAKKIQNNESKAIQKLENGAYETKNALMKLKEQLAVVSIF
ncbi:MAG: hypothetical protein ACRC6X_06635, partial [Culicoidibacterales bacterium]